MHSAVVTAGGDRVRWVELPGGAPVRVYLHGLGATSPAYFAASAAHPLLAGRRSLLVDLLGHGHSDRPEDFSYTLEAHADALAAALEQVGTGAAELIAHSMGGAVAIVLADRHPHLVSRLVLVDANLDPIPPDPAVHGQQRARRLHRAGVPGRRVGRGARPGRRALVVHHAAGGPRRPAPQRRPPGRGHDADDARAAPAAEGSAQLSVPGRGRRPPRDRGPGSGRGGGRPRRALRAQHHARQPRRLRPGRHRCPDPPVTPGPGSTQKGCPW
ncbi:alpha/beta fold hydrolase [Streptomyces sp. NPDC051546]|uniref:alpha/beta fold hydrolase n=1 Tax=Streptomyces sp. NPDC051546 TaxID=3365655 RepID=UPI0037BD2B87